MNLLWILADDFAPYMSRTYGHPQLHTPNLQRLAQRGTRFDQAFCTCPLSTPSNQSTWTGLYPRSSGVTLSPTPLPPHTPTLPLLLRQHGYETALIGKTHYYAPRPHEGDLWIDQAAHRAWQSTLPPRPLPNTPTLGTWLPFATPPSIWLNADNLPFPCYDDTSESYFYSSQAAHYLRTTRAPRFFLHVGLCETHSPFRVPLDVPRPHQPHHFTPPHVPPHDLAHQPEVFRTLRPAHVQGITAAYANAVEYFDRNLGRILDALDDSGHTHDTLVILSSDHGYLLGHHGRFEKHCLFDEAIRVALLLAGPSLPSQHTSSALISLVDLLPTVLDLLQLPHPPHLQGSPFTPLLHGTTSTHRTHLPLEYSDNAEGGIRTPTHKLVYCANNRRRADGYATPHLPPTPSLKLFDLVQDPHEHHDLAPTHSDLTHHLLQLLLQHLAHTPHRSDPPLGHVSPHEFLAHTLTPVEAR